MRQALIFHGEDGWWVAEVPSLPGCISQGKSREEAIANVTEAASLWIDAMSSLGEPIPMDSGSAEVVFLKAG